MTAGYEEPDAVICSCQNCKCNHDWRKLTSFSLRDKYGNFEPNFNTEQQQERYRESDVGNMNLEVCKNCRKFQFTYTNTMERKIGEIIDKLDKA